MKKMIFILCSFSLYLSGILHITTDNLTESRVTPFIFHQKCDHKVNVILDDLYNQAKELDPQDFSDRYVASWQKTHGINYDEVYDQNQNTLLHRIALVGGKRTTAQYLRDQQGVNPEQRNAEGKTAGQIANELGHHELAEFLGAPIVNLQPKHPNQAPDNSLPIKPVFSETLLTLKNGLIGTVIGLAGIYLWRRHSKKEIAQVA
jgi:hypothetical protein